MQYPLEITFKIWTIAPKITVTDANGNVVFFVKQKLFKLKEAIGVFADEAQTKRLYDIKADRIIDFSARYNFTDSNGAVIGAVKRKGMRSLWKAHYDIFNSVNSDLHIQEENPWVKVLDSLFQEVPILGALSGYVLNPKYLVKRSDGTVVMRLEKQPSLLSRKFIVKPIDQLSPQEETQVLLSLIMMILLERARG
ncbi:hypothetical protein IQ265_03710 [Nodosilinea sp. LEGE 06152]|uniref:hypothetical protein n=1 Tax=Nodosilinea sp. LEGE 06152 TaxID=2777966 RepID=UPI001880E3B7|nr:hypothetical protein [Nodosilinea sp. LEGE 06152]MBE9155941.1 hypothetical protein [Nodosilinea sp. LEGE 06152]